MRKVALIEAGAFHDECLHSQIQYLKESAQVTLFCHPKLESRVKDLPDVHKIVYFDLSSKMKKYQSWFSTWRRIVKGGFEVVIFNSAESNIIKLISFPFPKRIRLVGTLHNAHNLFEKAKQKKVTKKIDAYLTLNDFVAENVRAEKLTTKTVGSYYPIQFPEFPGSLKKPEGEVWVTVPGVISLDKRDYSVFKEWKIPDHVKVIFLGRPENEEAKAFVKEAKQYPSANQFLFFDSFVSNELFHDYIRNSDYIMPLIHPNNAFFSRFRKYKISGSYNLAFGYRIPLLMEQSFNDIADFKENAVFYDYDHIENLFDTISKTQKKYYQHPKWDFEFQKENYLRLIFGNSN
ncbi:hypothetical protein POV27_05180 [Aureisphaera galaxeae]|uniref:hypothetical protein n=1 Tax=Aureisphaera galaxeae TaxID=1538023 RepID=UPI00235069EE|nr:hypothetical protein [Aureisphaera galaxeae]MDC8003432.1 hypothetical protein [Aureisphaera galaxeae]